MITWRRPSDDELAQRAIELRTTPVTYDEVGATQATLPVGYRHDRHERQLGRGDEVWDRARGRIMSWATHRHAGVRVVPDHAPVEGATVVLGFRLGPVWVVAPCRIVAVVDTDTRVGFVYGTLPGHPERGEESFMVERLDDGTIRLVITAFSEPAEALVRLGAPVSRQIQRRVTEHYLDGLAEA